ncbi:LamG-like jellyroll fold domain-containing protein [Streptomyces sp. NPDC127114]|uniref:LamG-like jellyroll fold domain-containing protein n=1 Tax=Streptomyces sp. NPDC127114 TaxID=3345366 RepID=UPI003630CFE9
MATAAVSLLAVAGLTAQASASSTNTESGAEFPLTPASSPAADEAGQGRAFWQDDALPQATAEQVASRKAVASGQRVPVESLTSETSEVFANSDGTFTVETSPVVERVRKDGRWTPVDTTLVQRTDGLIEPKAGQEVTFSGGGSGPLARMTKDGRAYELGSPWALPRPTLTGSTAVYASVRPGIDLVVQARPDGFTQNLVVHDRTAAADPALKSVRFPVRTVGLEVRESGSGDMSLVDERGHAVFSSSGALMWDAGKPAATQSGVSTMSLSSPADAETDPVEAVDAAPDARTAVADVAITADAVAVTPNQGFLADPETTYPVVIDPPSVTASLTGWTTVWSNLSSTSFWKTSHTLGAGYDGWVDGKLTRALFQFDTRRVAGKKILNATFTAYEVWAANCTPQPVDLWRTGAISSSTTWSKQPAWSSKVTTVWAAKGYGDSCKDGDVEFNATAAVAYTAKAAATTTTLGLRAGSETDRLQWKQFMSPTDPDTTSTRKPRLSITYVSPPDTKPSYVKLADPNMACSASSSPAMIRDTTPRLTATPTSADGANASLRPNFELFDSANTKIASLSPSTWTASGTAGSVTTAALAEQKTYSFAARTEYRYTYGGTTTSLYGPWSARCYFRVDSQAPLAPTVTSSPYTECASLECASDPELGSVGMTGTFTITTPASDIRRFDTFLNGTPFESKVYGTDTKTHEVKLAPAKKGLNILRAVTYDAAGNWSNTDYKFNVAAGSKPLAAWAFDETAGTTAANTADGAGEPLTFSSTTSWAEQGRLKGAVHLDGTTSAGQTSAPVVDTLNNFSVSAWVRLTDRTHAAGVAGQPGTVMSSFQLYYSSYADRWVFARYSSDTTSGVTIGASSQKPPVLGAWTHLLGVYDQQAAKVRLYVNGRLQAESAYTTPFAGNAALRVGKWAAGGDRDFFPGDIDQLQVWNRVVFPDELGAQVNLENESTALFQPRLEAQWALDEPAGTTTGADSSDNARTITLDKGASFVDSEAQGHGNVLKLTGALDSSASAGVPLDNSGSFTVAGWVDVTDDTRLDDLSIGHAATILAHPGTQTSAFRLIYYQPKGQPDGYWILEMAENDVAGGPRMLLYSEVTEAPKGWVHVAATYDSVTGAARLYLTGVRQGDEDGALVKNTYQPTGPVITGKSRIYPTGAWGDTLLGQVDDLRVYSGVMSQQDITQLSLKDEPPVPIE